MVLHNNPVSRARRLIHRLPGNGIVEKPEEMAMKTPKEALNGSCFHMFSAAVGENPLLNNRFAPFFLARGCFSQPQADFGRINPPTALSPGKD
jgi:hypothetical protein